MGGKSKTVNNPTQLTERGGKQFDFAAGQLEDRFGRDPATATFNRGQSTSLINQLSGFGSSAGTNRSLNKLERFTGTQGAKSSLAQLGRFKGSADAFRTLGSLERFGAQEQGFVSDARSNVRNFDEGFESQVLPGLLQSARGDFLTSQNGNPFVDDLIQTAQRGSIQNFNESVLPNLLANFAGTGGVGSSLQSGFLNQQSRDLQRNLGDISTNISFDTFEAERGRQRAAQEAILGFENFGLDRQLQARTTDLGAAQTSAQQLLDARIAAGGQATQLSQQQLNALSGQAQGQTSLSGQTQASLQAAAGNRVQADAQRLQGLGSALQGELGASQLDFNTQQLNAQLENDRINQLIAAQQAAAGAGKVTEQKLKRSI